MANALFNAGKNAFLTGAHVWGTDNTRLILVDEGTDTPVPATDEDLADITAGARIAESGNFTYTSALPDADGSADADDVTLSSVSGATVESIVIFRETGTDATSTLLVYIDTVTPAFAFTPNGGDVTITWGGAPDYIFSI